MSRMSVSVSKVQCIAQMPVCNQVWVHADLICQPARQRLPISPHQTVAQEDYPPAGHLVIEACGVQTSQAASVREEDLAVF